jgi:hypothetical protein
LRDRVLNEVDIPIDVEPHPRPAQIMSGVGGPTGFLIWAASNVACAWLLKPSGEIRCVASRTRSRMIFRRE